MSIFKHTNGTGAARSRSARLLLPIPYLALIFATSIIGSVSAANDASASSSSCLIRPPVETNRQVIPTKVTSYPGSGLHLLRSLVEALTGFVTGTDFEYDPNQVYHKQSFGMVLMETHYPLHGSVDITTFAGHGFLARSILLLRNPLEAIPSKYIQQSRSGGGGLLKLALGVPSWTKWRDANFSNELDDWREHLEYWMDYYRPMIITYETLVGEETGVTVTSNMGSFLEEVDGVSIVVPTEELECVWRKVIHGGTTMEEGTTTVEEAKGRRMSSLRSDYGFTSVQMDEVLNVLHDLRREYYNRPELLPVLDMYITQVDATRWGAFGH